MKMRRTTKPGKSATRRGAVLVAAMVCVLILSLMTAALLRTVAIARQQARAEARRMQAELLADAAMERTVAQLRSDAKYTGEKWDISAADLQASSPAAVEIEVKPTDDAWAVRIQADFPVDASIRARAVREFNLAKSEVERK